MKELKLTTLESRETILLALQPKISLKINPLRSMQSQYLRNMLLTGPRLDILMHQLLLMYKSSQRIIEFAVARRKPNRISSQVLSKATLNNQKISLVRIRSIITNFLTIKSLMS